MKPLITWLTGIVLLPAAGCAPAAAGEPGPRPVADEFRETLARLSSNTNNPSPGTLAFTPRKARFVRVAIRATSGKTQPCIDELEVFGPGDAGNLAAAARGAAATASSLLPGYAIHRVAHLNDGRYGNDHSWIAAGGDNEWAQVELPRPATVSRVVVTRDRTGKYTDRIPVSFAVLVSPDGERWESVGRRDRPAAARSRRLPAFPVDRLPEKSRDGFLRYAFGRERAAWRKIPADDHLSPLRVDRPAAPGGPPYWGRLARLAPLERVLVLLEEMIDRLDRKGVDVRAARAAAAGFRRRAADNPDDAALYTTTRRAKRQLFFRDPALGPLARILFAKRHPFLESHNYSEHLDGILQPGGGVYVLQVPRDEEGRFRPDRARIRRLFDGGAGIVREPVPDYAAEHVYFAYRPDEPAVDGWASYWHLYRMRTDGTALQRLTGGPFHDFDPVCLPDGGVAFHSTRCAVRFLCWRPQVYVLYRMDADGTNIRRLSHANLSEWKPAVMHSGRLLWTRSEYLDKGADFGHTLWSIRPDGTHPALVFGNNTPNCYSQAREVPGTREIVCTLMSHGAHQGPVALIDRTRGPFYTAAITNITPDTRPHYQMSRSPHNTFRDPFPISRDHFLVSHNPDNKHTWCLYVIDRWGNREWLYADPVISSRHPVPLHPRPRPAVPARQIDPTLAAAGMGQFIVQDVYTGLGPSVARGRAKYLRVAEEVPADLAPLPDGQYCADHRPFTDFYAAPIRFVHGPASAYETRTTNAPAAPLRTNNDWTRLVSAAGPGRYRVREPRGWPSYVAKASLGTVPVAADGSASFLAPAGRVLYFQLLDAAYNELQRMRSVVQLQPGERRGCIGCHESRCMAPAMDRCAALDRPPRHLEPPPWGAGPLDYRRVVQPVLNARCVHCHDGGRKVPLDLRGTPDEHRVPASYRALIAGGWVHFFDYSYGMRHFKAEPLSFGTLRSRLWEVLADEDHREVALDEGQVRAIKAWTDLNCPLWPDYLLRTRRPGPPAAQARR